MKRKHVKALCALAAFARTITGNIANATDQETQGWLTENVSVRADSATTVSVDFNQRARSARAGGDQYLDRVAIDHSIAKGVSIGGGITYQYNDREKEIRIHEQITLTKGIVSARTRLEQRMFDTRPDVVWRVAERLQIARPLDRAKSWTLIANTDLFFLLNRQKPSDTIGFNQFRTQIGFRRQLTRHLFVQATYLRQQSIRHGRPDAVVNAPWLIFGWRL